MKINGVIKIVCDPKSGISKSSGREWHAQDFVIETSDENPQSIVFNIFGEEKISDACLNVGDNVTVDLNCVAREYNGRWFNSISLNEVKHHKESKKKTKTEKKETNSDYDELPF